ncbi:hypothetical protein BgiBS90_035415 [Biomphalaria glabrata]|nr:hypothetical protein BgiBS90_035415 [Biomphalaria glabrata]
MFLLTELQVIPNKKKQKLRKKEQELKDKYQPAAEILCGRDQCTQTMTSRIPQCKPDFQAPMTVDNKFKAAQKSHQ